MQLNPLLPVRVMLVTRHMAGVTLFVITANLALQLDEDQNNDMRRRGIARNRRISRSRRRIARRRRRIARSRRRIKTGWSLRRRPDLYNLSQIRFVHRSRWFGFGRSRSCCTGQGSACPGKKGLKHPTVALISSDLFYGFYLVRKVAIENLSCGLWLAIRETQTVETGNYFDHRQCTLYQRF